MSELGDKWGFEDLNSPILDASVFVPGTAMDGVAGIASVKRRAALWR